MASIPCSGETGVKWVEFLQIFDAHRPEIPKAMIDEAGRLMREIVQQAADTKTQTGVLVKIPADILCMMCGATLFSVSLLTDHRAQVDRHGRREE